MCAGAQCVCEEKQFSLTEGLGASTNCTMFQIQRLFLFYSGLEYAPYPQGVWLRRHTEHSQRRVERLRNEGPLFMLPSLPKKALVVILNF